MGIYEKPGLGLGLIGPVISSARRLCLLTWTPAPPSPSSFNHRLIFCSFLCQPTTAGQSIARYRDWEVTEVDER